MAVKFSAFTTRTGTLDASTKIVGYDDPAGTKTNVEFSLATLVDNVPTIYSADGTLSGNRTVTIPASGSLTYSSSGALSLNVTSSAGTTLLNGNIVKVPSTGRFEINSFNSQLSKNYVLLYSSAYITGTINGFVTVSNATGTSYSIDARLGVIGAHNDNTSYAFRVQNSDSTDIFSVSNDTTTTVEKNLVIKGQGYSELHTEASAATITPDWDNGNVYTTELTSASTTFADPTNIKPGATYIIILKQDGTGSRTVSWGTKYKFPGGTAPTLTTGANKADVITLVAYSTDILMCTSVLDFVTS